MLGWLFLLGAALSFATAAWLRGRPAKWIFPSDAFFLLCVLLAGTVPFVNLYATSPLYGSFYYSEHVVRTALVCLILMFLTMGIVWMLRPAIAVPDRLTSVDNARPPERARDASSATPILWAGILVFVVISLFMFAYGPYLTYKLEVFSFVTGQLTAEEYRIARRVAFAEDPVIEGIMGRLRFGIFPIMFVALAVLSVRKLGIVGGFAVCAVAFLVGPASMSKAPIFFYLAYFVAAICLEKHKVWFLRSKNTVPLTVAAVAGLMVVLTAVYFLQYRGMYVGLESVPDAFRVSYFRVFTATYDSLLKYITTFQEADVGIGGSVLAPLFGIPSRNLDAEVAEFFVGPFQAQYTSYPTIFIGNAYASFGYGGVVAFSAGVAILMWGIDRAFVAIHNRDLRITYFSVMMVNVTFFATIAAPTALFTYGNGVIPLLILALDRFAVPAHPRPRSPVSSHQVLSSTNSQSRQREPFARPRPL